MARYLPQSVGEAVAWGARELDGCRTDAQALLAYTLGLPRSWILAHPDAPVDPVASERYATTIGSRANGVPVAYLSGVVNWYDLQLAVTRDVLVPRPETELVVEAVLGLDEARTATVIADIGTGSGAIAIALARRLPILRVHAVDVSEAALHVARGNAARYDLLDRIHFHQGDLTAPLPDRPQVVAANLPYLSDPLMATVDRDVRHEPVTALYGGTDGLDLYRRLIEQIRQWDVLPVMALEIDPDQVNPIRLLLDEWSSVDVRPDYAGHSRVAVARP